MQPSSSSPSPHTQTRTHSVNAAQGPSRGRLLPQKHSARLVGRGQHCNPEGEWHRKRTVLCVIDDDMKWCRAMLTSHSTWCTSTDRTPTALTGSSRCHRWQWCRPVAARDVAATWCWWPHGLHALSDGEWVLIPQAGRSWGANQLPHLSTPFLLTANCYNHASHNQDIHMMAMWVRGLSACVQNRRRQPSAITKCMRSKVTAHPVITSPYFYSHSQQQSGVMGRSARSKNGRSCSLQLVLSLWRCVQPAASSMQLRRKLQLAKWPLLWGESRCCFVLLHLSLPFIIKCSGLSREWHEGCVPVNKHHSGENSDPAPISSMRARAAARDVWSPVGGSKYGSGVHSWSQTPCTGWVEREGQ